MSIIKSLMAKPWTAEQTLIDNRYPGDVSERPVKRLALRVFLGVVAVLFILLGLLLPVYDMSNSIG